MAPEQVDERPVDNRSDIFSLGLVAYQLLTGIRLFLPPSGLSFREQAGYYQDLLQAEIVPPHEVCRDVPEAYSQMIMKMLAVDPVRRYQKVDRVGSEIEKRFLYAEGFGPTNNSLAAYLKNFKDGLSGLCSEEDLGQLAFLADGNAGFNLKRRIGTELYTGRGASR